MPKKSAKEYLGNYGIDQEHVVHRYATLIKSLHGFINYNNLKDKVRVDGRILEQVVIDYFVDSVRVKEFHNIKNTNTEKIYAYTAYWLFRRKPLQALKNFDGCEFINELFTTLFLASSIATDKNISKDQRDNNPTFKKFQELLFYNLKYRPVSQQSLELMIEAFFCGCDFAVGGTP